MKNLWKAAARWSRAQVRASAKRWRGGGRQLPVTSESSQKIVTEIKSAGGKAIAIHADVSKERESKTLFATMFDEFGAIDILVNNAGV